MTTTPDQPDDVPPGDPFAPIDPAPPIEPPEPEPRRRLKRSRDDQMIGGVAGGLSEYFDLDPTLVRIALVVLAFLSAGTAVLGYVVAWIVMPEAEPGESLARPASATTTSAAPRAPSATGGLILGLLLIAAGGVVLLGRLDLDIRLPGWDAVLAAALILVGVLILLESRRGMHGGLVTLAIGLSVVLGAAAMFSFNFDSGFGEKTVRVGDQAALESSYSHAFGQMTVDLDELEPIEGTTRIELSIAFGQLDLLLPDGVPVRIEANSAFGNVDTPLYELSGIVSNRTSQSPGYDTAPRRLEIEVSVAFGSARIR